MVTSTPDRENMKKKDQDVQSKFVYEVKELWKPYTTLTQQEIKDFESKNLHDPFSFLGQHVVETSDGTFNVIRVLHPTAYFIEGINLEDNSKISFTKLGSTGLFEAKLPHRETFYSYDIKVLMSETESYQTKDPYSYEPVLSEYDLHLFIKGCHYQLYNKLGANLCHHQGIDGVLFSVWAPNAKAVSVVGNFNSWDGRRSPMRKRGATGVWELFIPELSEGELYKFEVTTPWGQMNVKADPYAKFNELRPNQANVVWGMGNYTWKDQTWQDQQDQTHHLDRGMSIYEVHLGSWKQKDGNEFYNYHDLINELIPYVKDMGFNYIELMPVAEHPLDQSWGYQVTNYFSPTSRYGNPDEFRMFVDACHQNGIGVILDWVPAHFPKDAHSLGKFDGTALYEHADSRQGEHPHWGTYIFNYGRNEVANFLISNALYWLKEFHIDGLRVDAVASMLYLDYGKEDGEWVPNNEGGNINKEALEFFKHLNSILHTEHPNCLMFAEESTSFPNITKLPEHDGLGYDYKWNMGWMNDFLTYMSKEPIHKKHHHNELTFSLLYSFSENFALVLSHDEVVHGKGSLINKMPGDDWQKFANLRALYAFMFAHPGKKLLFMGSEFAQYHEWNSNTGLDWHIIDDGKHSQMQSCLKQLNRLYLEEPALYELDHHHEGFEWLECDNWQESIAGFARKSKNGNQIIVALCNFTPVYREDYTFGVPKPGFYREIFNSDSRFFGGSDKGNDGGVQSSDVPKNHFQHTIKVNLPPLGISYFKLEE